VTERIVDGLEAVEVNEEDRRVQSRATVSMEGMFEALHQQDAVR
jgi:hypothetical protein